jgi:hypothetical protein
VLLGLVLSIVIVFLFDLFQTIGQRAWDQYEWEFARWIVALSVLLFLCMALPYLWFVIHVLGRVYPRVMAWISVGDRSALQPSAGPPGILTWIVCGAIAAALLRATLKEFRRNPFYAYKHALRTLGLRKFIVGILLMMYLRLLVPRRDFVLTAPVVSWAIFALPALLIHEVIPTPLLSAIIPLLGIAIFLPSIADAYAPPLWLFLGATRYEAFVTFYTLRSRWRRHGLTLLERVSVGGLDFYHAWRSVVSVDPKVPYSPGIWRVWSLRTRPAAWAWQTAVRLLATFAPVIIVDQRDSTPIVQWELEWLQRRGLMDKVYLVISADDGQQEQVTTTHPRAFTEETLMAAHWTDAGLVIDQPD